MILDSKCFSIRAWGMVGVSALAVVLVAAVSDSNRNWTRIRELPPEQRSKLLQNLRKFDLEVPRQKQDAIRELDRRIADLDPEQRRRYFSVLRRYHDWLNSLPENRQDDLLSQSAEERLSTIHKLISEYPVPTCETPRLLRIAEVGEFSPFELASVFRIWQALSPDDRSRINRLSQEHGRRNALFLKGSLMEKPIPRETRPTDYDEEKWVGVVEEFWRKTRPVSPLEDAAKKKLEVLRREIPRRQAINFYLLKTKIHSVEPERLARFIASLPSSAQATIDQYPPDERAGACPSLTGWSFLILKRSER